MKRNHAVRAGIGALLLIATPLVAAPDSIEQRAKPCMICHGEEGRATPDGFYPRIAGKPAGYLYEQLLHFQEGTRQQSDMTYLVSRQRDDYLHELATHFATLDLPYAAPPPPKAEAAELAHGEALVRNGDATRDVPACAACHGDRLTGLQPAVPGLVGLPFDYLVAQIGAWREGARHAREPDCMGAIARRLEPEEIRAVAAWLAAQPVPSDAHAPMGTIKTEVRCGSLEPRSLEPRR
jgi:cytochrome c553